MVSELLGHANPSITVNFYIHTSRQRIAKVYQEAAPLAGSVALPGPTRRGDRFARSKSPRAIRAWGLLCRAIRLVA